MHPNYLFLEESQFHFNTLESVQNVMLGKKELKQKRKAHEEQPFPSYVTSVCMFIAYFFNHADSVVAVVVSGWV